MEAKKGRVTIPTNLDVVKETLDIMDEWGADAIRDCDGTEFPQELMTPERRSTPLTTPQEKTTPGQKPTRTRSSRCTL